MTTTRRWPRSRVFLTYLLSFVILGIYWANHHHLIHATDRVNGKILWANLHLLFWLSLIPFVTGWMGENGFGPLPTAAYGVVLLLAGAVYRILVVSILSSDGDNSRLRAAIGSDAKGIASLIVCAVAVPLAFVRPWIADTLYVLVVLMWLVPDRRIESRL